MSIKLDHVIKTYQDQKALDDVSFEANKGEIMALLGPNGAGKSTSMKIISAYIPFDSGSVSVCGLDVNTHAEEIKQKIGYLPEHNPLYLDMYVKEYLSFVADIHQVKNKKQRIGEVIEMTGLELEQGKKIQSLSKGYRQRVGIAQSIFHDPEVLILDEPTSGLDPNQLIEIRNLIKSLAKEKTVILSTHIMQEVEAICDRVVVIDRGTIVANAATDELMAASGKQFIIQLELMNAIDDSILMNIAGVNKLLDLGQSKYKIYTDTKNDLRPHIFDAVVKSKNKIIAMNRVEQNIESVFQSLTN